MEISQNACCNAYYDGIIVPCNLYSYSELPLYYFSNTICYITLGFNRGNSLQSLLNTINPVSCLTLSLRTKSILILHTIILCY